MKIEELLKSYPAKSFTDKYTEKKNAFLSIGSQAAEFINKENSLRRIFEYDQAVTRLKDLLKEKGKVDNSLNNSIIVHFRRIGQFCEFLEQLNTSNPKNIQMVFEKFDVNMRQTGFLGDLVYKTSEGVDVRSRESVAGIEIRDIEGIINVLVGTRDATPQFEIDVQKLKEAEGLATKILNASERYQKAAEAAENWITTEGRAVSSAIKDKTKIFNEKADVEHTKHRVWWWLAASLIFVVGAIATSLFFISKLSGNGEGISIGAALLRISVVAMFFYLSYLAHQQFSIQRKLYEAYKFKAIALSTMEDLVKTYTERGDRELIVGKALDIIFSEPTLKEDKVVHQRVIDDLLDVLKKKI